MTTRAEIHSRHPSQRRGSLGASVATKSPLKKPTLRVSPIIFAVIVCLYFSFPEYTTLRDSLYAMPTAIILELAASRSSRYDIRVLYCSLLYLLYSSFFLFSELRANTLFKESVFVFLSALIFAPNYETSPRLPTILLLSAFANIAISEYFSEAGIGEISFLQSTGLAETSFGLILPLASIIFYIRKNSLLLVISLILSFIMYKRIALFAIFICILFDMFFYRRTPGLLMNCVRRTVAISLLSSVIILSLTSQFWFDLISQLLAELFGVYTSPNSISSGRYLAANLYWHHLVTDNSLLNWVVGNGPGHSTATIESTPDLSDWNFMLLHNDWLRILGDYGVVGIAIAATAFWRAMFTDRVVGLVAVYIMILFISDNILTYFAFWVAVAFTVRSALPSNGHRMREMQS